jgi:hypothetical protein
MTYLSLFQNVYIAAKLKADTDIIKDYDTYPLLAKSTPKNTLTITTSNSKDWADYSDIDTKPLVSSTTAVSGNTPGTGLRSIASTNQSLIMIFKAAYSEVTKTSSTAATVATDNWGMMIMMSPKIKFLGSTLTLT